MTLVAIGCGYASSESQADWGSVVGIKNEAAFFEAIDLSRPELTAVREAVAKADWPAAKSAWGRYLEEHIAPRWVWSSRDREQMIAFLKAHGDQDRAFDDAEKMLGEVRVWIAENPCTSEDSKGAWHRLEVARRMGGGLGGLSWFDKLNLFIGLPAFDAELRYQMSRVLLEHARWLYRNPRIQGYRDNNIHSSMVCSLMIACIMLPEAKEAADWKKLALIRLRERVDKGVFPDGAHQELTPNYHWHVTNQYLQLKLLAQKNGFDEPGLFDRHEKMIEFMLHLLKPNRNWVSVADGGGGGKDKVPYAMATGALLYDRADMRYFGPEKVPAALVWKLPPEQLERYAMLPARKPDFLSHMLPYSQYGVMRTGWDETDRWLFVDYAPYAGPHTHWDQLQVVLYSGGRDLLLDQGAGPGYQSKERPYYLSAAAHNVLLINGVGISRHEDPQVITWSVKPGAEFVSGKAENKEAGCRQQRSVLFVKPDYWVVFDHVSGAAKEAPTFKRLFHLPPNELQRDEHAVRTTFAEGDNLWLHAADGAPAGVQFDVLPTGEKAENPVVFFEAPASLPAALCTLLVPFAEEQAIPTAVERLASDDPEVVVLRVQFGDGRTDWIAVAPTVRELQAGNFSGKGMALCARTDRNGQPTAFEVFGVTPLQKTTPE